MKKPYLIAFIVAFLCIIYAVPLVQTVFEFRCNPGHRIQMLDLIEDILITPTKKMRADAALIDSLTLVSQQMKLKMNNVHGDTARPFDPQPILNCCEEAAFKVTLLKKSVADYNRHLQAGKNMFASRDTGSPYYLSLIKLGADLETVQTAAAGGRDALSSRFDVLSADIL